MAYCFCAYFFLKLNYKFLIHELLYNTILKKKNNNNLKKYVTIYNTILMLQEQYQYYSTITKLIFLQERHLDYLQY